MSEPQFKKPVIFQKDLSGNIFSWLGAADRALRRAGYREKAIEMADRLHDCRNYEDVKNLVRDYVEVK